MQVPFIDLSKQHKPIKKEMTQAFNSVFRKGQFILGEEVKQCEQEIASYVDVRHGIGVSNGTNALLLSLKALGVTDGDEVITTPFTFVATAEVIANLGARPVFCDIDPATFNIDSGKIEQKITSKTKAMLPVHLFGQAADMVKIMNIAKEHNVSVIEDMAQALGAAYKGKKVGSFGDTAAISFFPTKNLSALGDAGMILTDNDELATRLRAYRVHGASKKYQHEFLGYNDRLDELQAAFLRVKFEYMDEWNNIRRRIAHQYDEELKDIVATPFIHSDCTTIYHQYTIRIPGNSHRDELQHYLSDKGIATAIHYPIPLHLQPAFKYLGYKEGDFTEAEKAAKEVLSLPIHHNLSDKEVDYVIKCIRRFFRK